MTDLRIFESLGASFPSPAYGRINKLLVNHKATSDRIKHFSLGFNKQMDDHNDFDNVSWRNDVESDNSRPNTAEASKPLSPRNVSSKRTISRTQMPQAGQFADPVDLAGVGDGVIECTVDSPLKENDGTKDAHISYLITTHVR